MAPVCITTLMDARSIITFPTFPSVVQKGWIEIPGIAWSGRGKIVRVDVSTDKGKNWYPAQLQVRCSTKPIRLSGFSGNGMERQS